MSEYTPKWPAEGRPVTPRHAEFSQADVEAHGLPDWARDDDLIAGPFEVVTVAQWRANHG